MNSGRCSPEDVSIVIELLGYIGDKLSLYFFNKTLHHI
jgi:hypothetical protein